MKEILIEENWDDIVIDLTELLGLPKESIEDVRLFVKKIGDVGL